MNGLRLDTVVWALGIACVGACGDDGDADTGNDTQTASNSNTLTGDDSASASESSSASASVTATETGTAESGGTTEGSTTATTTGAATESSTGNADSGSSGSSGDSGSGSSSETGMACSMDQESCANGETCCPNLDCCSGQPIPPGQEYCSAGPCPISDRNKKENFAAVDPGEVLDKVAALPITTWNYTFEDASVRHIGPMAQDFQAAFAVGASDKSIFQVDADGVVLASVQALHGELEALKAENDELRERLAKLEASLAKRGRR